MTKETLVGIIKAIYAEMDPVTVLPELVDAAATCMRIFI